jgi:hypothetical protein
VVECVQMSTLHFCIVFPQQCTLYCNNAVSNSFNSSSILPSDVPQPGNLKEELPYTTFIWYRIKENIFHLNLRARRYSRCTYLCSYISCSLIMACEQGRNM